MYSCSSRPWAVRGPWPVLIHAGSRVACLQFDSPRLQLGGRASLRVGTWLHLVYRVIDSATEVPDGHDRAALPRREHEEGIVEIGIAAHRDRDP